MKCHKCSKSAVVHLTEVVTDAAGTKRAMEIHLCLGHAVEAGLIAPGTEILPPSQAAMLTPFKTAPKEPASADTGLPTTGGESNAIVPSKPPAGGLTVVRDKNQTPGDPTLCPVCGTMWSQFKQTGLMGCPHDYEMFEAKLLPLLKRAQEGAGDHVGKVPPRRKTEETERQVTSLRLRRELQKAIDAENYEQAARLRDQLRTLEK